MHGIKAPPFFLSRKVRTALTNEWLDRVSVWNYLFARAHEKNQAEMSIMTCGAVETIPENPDIWVEAQLPESRDPFSARDCWRVVADFATGWVGRSSTGEHRINATGPWVCIAQSRWLGDIEPVSRFPGVNQFAQTIEHACLMDDGQGRFPERVYVTLITPRLFALGGGAPPLRRYREIFERYLENRRIVLDDLGACTLPFHRHSREVLEERLESLRLNWVSFEDLLGIDDLIELCSPGQFRCTRGCWREIFAELGREDLYFELAGLDGA